MQHARTAGVWKIAGWILVLVAISLAAFAGVSLPGAASVYLLGAQSLLAWAGFGILLRPQSRIAPSGGGLLLMVVTVGAACWAASQVAVEPSVGLATMLARRLLLLEASAWMAVSLGRNGLSLAIPWLVGLLPLRVSTWFVLPGLVCFFGSPALAWAPAGFAIASLGLRARQSAEDIAALRREVQELLQRIG